MELAGPQKILSPCHCAVLRKASRHVSLVYDNGLVSTGLKTTQFTLMAAIDRAQADLPTMKELSEILVMDRSTLGQNLRPLEQRGFIKIQVDKEDARSRHVRLTAKGRAKLKEARLLWHEIQARFESRFGAEPTATLRGSLLTLATTDFSTASRN